MGSHAMAGHVAHRTDNRWGESKPMQSLVITHFSFPLMHADVGVKPHAHKSDHDIQIRIRSSRLPSWRNAALFWEADSSRKDIWKLQIKHTI